MEQPKPPTTVKALHPKFVAELIHFLENEMPMAKVKSFVHVLDTAPDVTLSPGPVPDSLTGLDDEDDPMGQSANPSKKTTANPKRAKKTAKAHSRRKRR